MTGYWPDQGVGAGMCLQALEGGCEVLKVADRLHVRHAGALDRAPQTLPWFKGLGQTHSRRADKCAAKSEELAANHLPLLGVFGRSQTKFVRLASVQVAERLHGPRAGGTLTSLPTADAVTVGLR